MTEAVSRPLGVPAFRPIPPSISEVGKRATIQPNPEAQNTFNRKTMQQYPSNIMSQVSVAIRPPRIVLNKYFAQINNLTFATGQPFQAPPVHGSSAIQKIPKSAMPVSNIGNVPAFQAMPSSVSRISTGQIVHIDNVNDLTEQQFKREVSYIQGAAI